MDCWCGHPSHSSWQHGDAGGVTLEADRLVAVVLLGELAEGRLHDTAAAEWTLSGYYRLRDCCHPPAISPQKSGALVRGDALLVLDFSFDILSSVPGPDLECDGLARRGLSKALHLSVCWGGCSASSLKTKS